MDGDVPKKKPRAKLFVFFSLEGDKDLTSFKTFGEYKAWKKAAPRVSIIKMIRGHERDHEVGRRPTTYF